MSASSLPIKRVAAAGRRVSGVTLIEMLVVIVIITIIAAISIPAFISIGRGYGMRHTVSTVFNHLSLARQWAITHREMVEFHYASGAADSTFWIVVPPDLNLINVTTNSPGIDYGGNSGFVKFKTDGGLLKDNLDDASIQITDQQSGQTVSITIKVLTGAITVE